MTDGEQQVLLLELHMKRRITMPSILVSLMVAILAGFHGSQAVNAVDFTSLTPLHINSQGVLGNGLTYEFTPENSTSRSTHFDGTRLAVAVQGIRGSSMEPYWFTVELAAPHMVKRLCRACTKVHNGLEGMAILGSL